MAPRKTEKPSKQRLLDALVERFQEYDRDQLYRIVMCSEVKIDGAVVCDPAFPVASGAQLELVVGGFVSRGGDKLVAALDRWGIDPSGAVWLDAGASAGGFTDVLLDRGAVGVHTVDVGYNQLDYNLRVDTRVYVHERTNILDVTRLEPPAVAAVCDLSFRSLRRVLAHILDVTTEGWGIALLKPQFELAAEVRWGRRACAPSGGVVSGALREEVIASTIDGLAEEGVLCEERIDSPVSGRFGNREVLLRVRCY